MIFGSYHFVRRRSATASQFIHAGRVLPTAVTTIAFIAANCGALEVVGLAAASAKYGALALHFYWIGTIPTMIFLAVFMMPVYAQSNALMLPEFLRLRYNRSTQILVCISLIVMVGLVSGINFYAIASLLWIFIGWSFGSTITLTLLVTSCYVLLGGLKGTIYNEIVQLIITIIGLAPLSYLVIKQFHGLGGLIVSLPEQMRHLWVSVPLTDSVSSPMDISGIVAGGFVLSFGYWCTDFMLIQRALAARDIHGSISTPIFAGFVKPFSHCWLSFQVSQTSQCFMGIIDGRYTTCAYASLLWGDNAWYRNSRDHGKA